MHYAELEQAAEVLAAVAREDLPVAKKAELKFDVRNNALHYKASALSPGRAKAVGATEADGTEGEEEGVEALYEVCSP